MRQWQFGIFDSQAADINVDQWGARSILVWGSPTNQEESVPDYNDDYSRIGQTDYSDFANQMVVDIALDQIKAKLGQIPVLLRVNWSFVMVFGEAGSIYWYVHRMYHGWDIGDSTNRYSDKSALIPWYEDAYSPYPGQDRTTSWYSKSETGPKTIDVAYPLDVTEIVELALRNNESIKMLFMTNYGQNCDLYVKPILSTKRPRLDFWYFYPIEFYKDDGGGGIDYSSPIQEAEDGHYYLGPVERGQTGLPVKCHIRNYTTGTQQVEIFDDHPEWTTPVQRVGTGTGGLDFVTLSESATSQLYTAVFYSATQYEVLAVAYRDNYTNYHPQINADASWRGTVGADKTLPEGGMTIPAAAWQGVGIDSGDEFEIGVRGNTTDTSWPYDSNDQVEITYDDGGLWDSGAWRPVTGHRQSLTAAVDVDSSSVFFPLRHIVPADWPASTPCFVHNLLSIDEGTITSTQERSLAAAAFTGSGLDDCTISGNFNGNADHDYRVVIDATGATDTYSVSRTGDATYFLTGQSCSTSPVLIENGVYVTFGAITGHTAADLWDSAAKTWGVTVGGLTPGSNSYNSGDIVATTLPIRDIPKAVWSAINADCGFSSTPANRIYLESTVGFTEGDTVYVQALGTGDYESAVIAGGGVTSTYLTLLTALENDYVAGDFCTKEGSGEDSFWVRPVANITTVEELKRLRINARML